MVVAAEERGFVEPAELEALALEHELAEDDLEQLTRELEAIGLEIGEPVAGAPGGGACASRSRLPPRPRRPRKPRPRRSRTPRTRGTSSRAPQPACSSSSPTSA